MTTNPTDPAAVEAWRAAYAAVYGCEITHPAYMYGNAYPILQSYGDQREAAARAEERARCVQWLRTNGGEWGTTLSVMAASIERGDHMKGSGGE